jgi:U3 small nucleolar RNA-associated protein 10
VEAPERHNSPLLVKMTSAFVAQLNEIASKSRNELDLKAQKTAHSESLIFDKSIARSQDIETIFQICIEGFEDLCKIDARFLEYRRNLFSQQSKTQERDQMTADQNAELDTVIEACLGLLGGRLLLNPAVKAAEWLVRRFRYAECSILDAGCWMLNLHCHHSPLTPSLQSTRAQHFIPSPHLIALPYNSSLSQPSIDSALTAASPIQVPGPIHHGLD